MVGFRGITPINVGVQTPDQGPWWWSDPKVLENRSVAVWTLIPKGSTEWDAHSFLVEHLPKRPDNQIALRRLENPDDVEASVCPLQNGAEVARKIMEHGSDHPGDIYYQRPAGKPTGTAQRSAHIRLDLSHGLSSTDALTTPRHLLWAFACVLERSDHPLWQATAEVLDPGKGMRQAQHITTIDPFTFGGFDEHMRESAQQERRRSEKLAHQDARFLSLRDIQESVADRLSYDFRPDTPLANRLRLHERMRQIAHLESPETVGRQLEWGVAVERKRYTDQAAQEPNALIDNADLFSPNGVGSRRNWLDALFAPNGVVDVCTQRAQNPHVHDAFLAAKAAMPQKFQHYAATPQRLLDPNAEGFRPKPLSVRKTIEALSRAKTSRDLPVFVLPDSPVTEGSVLRSQLADMAKARPAVIERLRAETDQLAVGMELAATLAGDSAHAQVALGLRRGVATINQACQDRLRNPQPHLPDPYAAKSPQRGLDR